MRAHALVAAIVFVLGAGAASAQQQVRCASRDFQYQFCPVGDVRGAALVQQISRAPCIDGQSWGTSRRGIWVSNGCEAVFRVDTVGPIPPVAGPELRIDCDSRDRGYQFCDVNQRVLRADLVQQKSQTPCVLGRNWGWRGEGVWVNDGCRAEFVVQTAYGPVVPPPGPGFVHCESQEYRYNFCATGPIRNAQLVEQVSRAPCVRGSSWGVERNGVWVDNGCEGRFQVNRR